MLKLHIYNLNGENMLKFIYCNVLLVIQLHIYAYLCDDLKNKEYNKIVIVKDSHVVHRLEVISSEDATIEFGGAMSNGQLIKPNVLLGATKLELKNKVSQKRMVLHCYHNNFYLNTQYIKAMLFLDSEKKRCVALYYDGEAFD